MDKKHCYICLPISGVTSDLWERLNTAKKEAEAMGFIPVSPLEVNNQTEQDPQYDRETVGVYMGRDLQTIIDDCDLIYVCNGWELSKGCNVEVECAIQYYKEIIYQTIPTTFSFEQVITHKRRVNAYKMEYAKETGNTENLEILESEWRLIKYISRQFLENGHSPKEIMGQYYQMNITNE